MRGKRWESWMDDVLRERFAVELNAVLARELGVGVRSVERHARMLGLEKGEAFAERAKELSADGYRRYCEYMRITGQKIRRSGVCGKPFEKGHKFDPDVEERRIAAIRARSDDERRRILRGVSRKTGWKMVDYATGKKV